jgi:hypothetical protein
MVFFAKNRMTKLKGGVVDLYLLLALRTAGRAGVERAGTRKINGQMRRLFRGWAREVRVVSQA